MTELQSKLLDMFSWFHSFCIEHKLRYYTLGGTALGAVRHKGFIPWDDDVDVGMPREDYERLMSLSSSVQNSKYIFEFPSDKKDFVYAFGKMYDTDTTLVENTKYKTKRGIYIDIFPLDGIGNSQEESAKQFAKLKRINDLLHMRICSIRKGRKWYKNFAVLLFKCLPGFIFEERKLREKLIALAKEKAFDKSEYVINVSGAWGAKEIHKRSVYGTPLVCKFEGIDVFIQEDADSYLTGLYGDYMKLPPIEKRVTHHDFLYIDLNKSYLDNKEEEHR